MLTPHQEEKYNQILDLLRAGHKRILLLGSAGVGKTYLADQIVKAIKSDYSLFGNRYSTGEVFVTAPTNKALAVLKGKVNNNVVFCTIHSALKLSRYIDSRTGQEVFKRTFSKKNELAKAKALIIDEVSMLNSQIEGGKNDQGEYVSGYLDDYSLPIIYIGDNKQINPVGEEFSPVFHKGYPEVELTEIIRQGNGNPIIELSRDLDMIFFKMPKLIDNKGYVYDNDRMGLIDQLAEVNGTDEMKYLAFTNRTVDDMNKMVRERRYGVPKKIEKDETIVFNSPYGSFYTNKEEKVLDYDIITDNIPVPRAETKYDSYNSPINKTDQVKMKFYRINDAFNVIHEESEAMFDEISKMVNLNCAKFGWDYKGKYFFNEQFADIKYNHAITIHKSQGSTYKRAVLNIADIYINKRAVERTRLLYTGVTRASDLVILNNVQ